VAGGDVELRPEKREKREKPGKEEKPLGPIEIAHPLALRACRRGEERGEKHWRNGMTTREVGTRSSKKGGRIPLHLPFSPTIFG